MLRRRSLSRPRKMLVNAAPIVVPVRIKVSNFLNYQLSVSMKISNLKARRLATATLNLKFLMIRKTGKELRLPTVTNLGILLDDESPRSKVLATTSERLDFNEALMVQNPAVRWIEVPFVELKSALVSLVYGHETWLFQKTHVRQCNTVPTVIPLIENRLLFISKLKRSTYYEYNGDRKWIP